tara:strand:- start:43 stop:210 length:168 start_codon:yes stop_codon:yes gene_type:complete
MENILQGTLIIDHSPQKGLESCTEANPLKVAAATVVTGTVTTKQQLFTMPLEEAG